MLQNGKINTKKTLSVKGLWAAFLDAKALRGRGRTCSEALVTICFSNLKVATSNGYVASY